MQRGYRLWFYGARNRALDHTHVPDYSRGMPDLVAKRCVPCEGGVPALDSSAIGSFHEQTPEWIVAADEKSVSRRYQFKNFHQTMSFVNAIAWIANREDHHPDLEVSYDFCVVRYTTHAIGGLSENDFICAAKVDALLA